MKYSIPNLVHFGQLYDLSPYEKLSPEASYTKNSIWLQFYQPMLHIDIDLI